MEQEHPDRSEADRRSFPHVVNHLGQNLLSVLFTVDVLALLKHYTSTVP